VKPRSGRGWRAVFGAAALGCALEGGPVRAAAPEPAAAAAEGDAVGPRDLPVPAGAVVAGTFEELRALVEDPGGPKAIALTAQVYRGDLVIKRPLSLTGRRGAVLEGTGGGTVVTVKASDVLVSDVLIRRSGHRNTTEDAGFKATGERVRIAHARLEDTLFGVSFEECKACAVEGVSVLGFDEQTELRGDGIKLWESHHSTVRHAVVERVRDVVVWYTRHATLEDVVVRGSRYGTHLMYAHDASVRRSRFEGNVVGIFVMYSGRMLLEQNVVAGARGAAGMGFGFKDSDAITARGNWLVANTSGLYLDNTPRTTAEPVVFEGNVIALNDVGLRLHSAEKGLSFRGNDLRQNALVVEADGGGSALAVEFRGNHFSEYEGYDLNGDGVGDVPFEVKALSSDLTESRPTLKFFQGTAAIGLLDAVAHAVPLLAARKLLVDPAPLVRPPDIHAP
jgi:nitrous oxidase accessory protein